MINELSRENIKELNGKPVWACIWLIQGDYDWFLKIRKPKIDLWHVPRYEKFSYQGYLLFMLKKVIREIVDFCWRVGKCWYKITFAIRAKTNSKIYCLLNFPHKWRNKNNQRGVYPYWLYSMIIHDLSLT